MSIDFLIEGANNLIWSVPLIGLCLIVGLFFTIRTGLLQIRNLPDMLNQLKKGNVSPDGTSSFQSLMMSLAGRVGMGNIGGVATAIAFGGPGAVFWMWASAFLGASTSFIECTLGQIYKEKDRDTGEYRGGPAYYFEKAYKHKAPGLSLFYGILFAIVTIIAMSFFLPGVQANGMASAIDNAWGIPTWVTAIGLVILLGFIVIGGVKRIAHFAVVVVPVMAIFYIIVAVVVFLMNFEDIPRVFGLIFGSAFGVQPIFGAIVGLAIKWGVQRGIYSNEAGQGTGPHAAAAAEVSHPAKQGFAQSFSVYIDTLFVCSATAFIIISTGMFNTFQNEDWADGESPVIGSGVGDLSTDVEPGPGFVQQGLDSVFPGFGPTFIAIALGFFVFTTIVAYYYMAEVNLNYLTRKLKNRTLARALLRILQALVLISVAYGAVNTAGAAWGLGDIGVGSMAWLNIVGILFLQVPALKALKDYRAQKKQGLDPQFDPRKLGIEGATFWELRADGLELQGKTGDDLPPEKLGIHSGKD
ncbi:alanine/glycine:cation symporter family protein [Brachybacterium alimentarium]|uniref:alanine/glycine:cation symporter family protein n=2 Tax=Brachybacterium alimentarium TaxID=47845 RepID=UPI000DF14031|nr:alanine/glycine:cation symporter family protein [Brachybacterium alimentarium]RCS65943.1 alanine:cation symporter family protein [Brachybacterium alimentarium]RCS87994.1 alanine:cation symporter family protein [Brachybacterium alimentarium]